MFPTLTDTRKQNFETKASKQHPQIDLVVMKLAADNSESVVDHVLVDVYFRESLRRPAWHPSSVALVIDHH